MLNHLLQNQKHTVKEKQDMRYTQISGNHFTKVDLFISLTNRKDGIGVSRNIQLG